MPRMCFKLTITLFSEHLSKDFNLFLTFGFLLLSGDTKWEDWLKMGNLILNKLLPAGQDIQSFQK